MSNVPDLFGSGDPSGWPDPPPIQPLGHEPRPSPPSYDHWTRESLVYYWVRRRGNALGCLWASLEHPAAGFLLAAGATVADLPAAEVWEERLAEAYGRGLPALDAVRRWRGAAEDSVGGAVTADEHEHRASSLQELFTIMHPGVPVPDGPTIQDGKFPDGTPVDRSQGWGPLVDSPPPSYPEETDARVRYLPVTLDGMVVGYVWASVDGRAAGYLNRIAAGSAGEVAAGLWKMRLSDSHSAGDSSVEALRKCAAMPHDRMSGAIGQEAREDELSSLGALRELARR